MFNKLYYKLKLIGIFASMITDSKNRLQPENFVELFELIAQDSGSRLILLQLKTVSLFFSALEEEITIELVDYTLTMDNSSLNHIKRKHGNQTREDKKKQIAVVNGDFERIEEVVEFYDNIEYKGLDKSTGNQLIKLEKIIDGVKYICIQEIRATHQRLNLKTLYKKKSR